MHPTTARTVERALEFVQWYRRMVIEGQIIASRYALARMPEPDYFLQAALKEEAERAKEKQ